VLSVSHLCANHLFQFPSVLLVIRDTFVSSTAYQNINAVSQPPQKTSQVIFQFIYLFGECKSCLKVLKSENQQHKAFSIMLGKCQTHSSPYCWHISVLDWACQSWLGCYTWASAKKLFGRVFFRFLLSECSLWFTARAVICLY